MASSVTIMQLVEVVRALSERALEIHDGSAKPFAFHLFVCSDGSGMFGKLREKSLMIDSDTIASFDTPDELAALFAKNGVTVRGL